MFNARQNNAGWRIDYFVVSDRLRDQIYRTPIHSDILGSDHCPVELDLSVSCNGGIWQSESEGQASRILPERKALSNTQKNAVRAGIAAGLLAVGFAGGYFTNYLLSPKEPEYTTNNLPQSTYFGYVPIFLPLETVSASDAADMTTDELIDYVVRIPQLQNYASPVSSTMITLALYEQCKADYPALAELEKRGSEAATCMQQRLSRLSYLSVEGNVLSFLLSLDVYQIPETVINNA